MSIILKDEAPIARFSRRLAPSKKEIVEDQVRQWLDDGIIVPSKSEFASQVVVTWKKNGKSTAVDDLQEGDIFSCSSGSFYLGITDSR